MSQYFSNIFPIYNGRQHLTTTKAQSFKSCTQASRFITIMPYNRLSKHSTPLKLIRRSMNTLITRRRHHILGQLTMTSTSTRTNTLSKQRNTYKVSPISFTKDSIRHQTPRAKVTITLTSMSSILHNINHGSRRQLPTTTSTRPLTLTSNMRVHAIILTSLLTITCNMTPQNNRSNGTFNQEFTINSNSFNVHYDECDTIFNQGHTIHPNI